MRLIILVLILSACSAYPQLDWPAGVQTRPAPSLLPQSEFLGGPVAQDSGPALVARADALRAWASSVAR